MRARLSTPAVLEAIGALREAQHGGGSVLPYVDALKTAVLDRYHELEEKADPPLSVRGLPLERVLLALEDEVWESELPKDDKIATAATVGAVRDHVIEVRREASAGN